MSSSSLRRPGNRQSLKLRHEAGILSIESTRRNENITLAHATEVLLSSASSSVIRTTVELALEVGNDNLLDVLEDVSLEKTLTSGVAFNCVAVDVTPDVVDGMEERGCGEGWATACCVLDEVVWTVSVELGILVWGGSILWRVI